MDIVVGTQDGIHSIGNGRDVALRGRAVDALVSDGQAVWAIADSSQVVRDGEQVAASPALRLNCLAVADGTVLAGTSEAHLLRLEADDLRRVEPFDRAEGREDWYTPWGGPADVRSIAAADGTLYVNVHVGGILRSEDEGRTWSPTIDIDADVHQVITDPADPTRVRAATAYGLADSSDGGRTWTMSSSGLHATYCRAVALAADTILISCSTGPRGSRAGVYRRPLAGGAFERCHDGLPDWFADNIDTACLAADGSTVAFGTATGEVFGSADVGRTWERVAEGLPPVRGLLLAAS